VSRHWSISAALVAAILFGAATPFAKQLLGEIPSTLLAGLLYLGSGLGLLTVRLIRDGGWRPVKLKRDEYRWLGGAIAFGGVIAPVLLMIGLSRTAANTASLLLNLEAVFTALIAWWIFKENAGRRIVWGMALIVAGGIALAWPSSMSSNTNSAAWIAAACACWAIDNNLTRKVSANDALFLAGSKGLIAGLVNTFLAVAMGAAFPDLRTIGAAMAIGLFGYGVSLVLFVVALRGLGTSRTGAYFSIAPFVGVLIAGVFFGEAMSTAVWIAGLLMTIGVVLHMTEDHTHGHAHPALLHEHPHTHDEHHQHVHDFPWNGQEPHTHSHRHEPLRHSHEHYPDIHHRHEH
jgi:drug/metabolite transporter (DMT)-like permease